MSAKHPYPEFASEIEEADWLYEHRDELDEYFTPKESTLAGMLLEHDLVAPAAIFGVPLSADDLARAHAIAESQGLALEEYIGRVVHDALQVKQAA
jgi:hypothetical protein